MPLTKSSVIDTKKKNVRKQFGTLHTDSEGNNYPLEENILFSTKYEDKTLNLSAYILQVSWYRMLWFITQDFC